MSYDDGCNESDFDVIKAVESCFPKALLPEAEDKESPYLETNVVPSELSETNEEETSNIFMFYDTKMSSLERKLLRTRRKLKQESIKLKQLERKLLKKRKLSKPLCVYTLDGRRYMCKMCKFQAKSWGKACAHIRKIHTKISLNCQFCNFKTFNPDSKNRHIKKCTSKR